MTFAHHFKGYPAEAIQFLRDLSANNNKDWFEANKATFIESVQKPALALVVALGEGLQAKFPAIQFDTRINGGGSLMRMYRDTRFSTDKSPYKTNVAMMFNAGTGKKMESPGFGLQLTPDNFEIVTGIFTFPRPMLEVFRQAVLDEKRGEALDFAVKAVKNSGDYTIEGAHYKRVPSGHDATHPRAEWLKYTGLWAQPPAIALDVAQTPELVNVCLEHFQNMSPLWVWLSHLE